MHNKSTTVIAILSLLGLVAGALFGIFAPDTARSLGLFGNLFISILVVLAIPMIIANVAVAASLLGDSKKIARTSRNSVWYYLILGGAGVVIGLLTSLIIRPGAHDTVRGGLESMQPQQFGDLYGFFASYFSPNIAQQIGQGQFLTLVLFSLLFGAYLVATSGKLSTSGRFFKDASGAMNGIVGAVAPYIPLGIFALTASQFARYYPGLEQVSGSLGYYITTVAIGTVLMGAVILPLALKLFGKESFGAYFGRLVPAMTNALGTASSSATLPFTWEATSEGNKVDERAASVSLPLGVVLNVGATAMFSIITFLFLTQSAGVSVSIGQLVLLCVMALILSIGTTGLPRVSVSIVLVLLGMFSFDAVLTSPALPVIILVDLLIVDRIRALINVWGDAVGAAVISQTFEMKTAPRKITHSSQRTSRPDRRDRSSRPDRRDRSSRRSDSDRPDRRQRDSRRGGSDRSSDRSRGRDRRERPDRQDRPDRGGRGRSRDNDNRNDNRSETREASPFEINANQPSGIDMDTAARIDKPERPSRSPQDRSERQSESPDRSHRRNDSRSPSRSSSRSSSDRPSSDRSRSSAPEAESIPAETIKRERAKVAAQLAAMKQDKPIEEPDQSEVFEDEEVKVVRPVEDSEPDNNETTEPSAETATAPQRSADHSDRSKPAESREAEPVKPAEEEEPEPVVSYGRTRKSKTPKSDDDTEETPAAETGESKEPEFSTDDISFGRGKRKKVR